MPRPRFRFASRRLALAALLGLIILPLVATATTRKTTSSRKRTTASATREESSSSAEKSGGSSSKKSSSGSTSSKKSTTTKSTSSTSSKSKTSTTKSKTSSTESSASSRRTKSSTTRTKSTPGKSTRSKSVTSARKSTSGGSSARRHSTLSPPKAPAEADDFREPPAPSAASLDAEAAAAAVASAKPVAPRGTTSLDRVAPFRRCLWVSRWEYEREQDIVKICYNAASARFTDIFFQVRGAGSVAFRSSIEPWAPQLAGSIGRSPGYDPLATAIREAHKYGLRVHAYMNALPGAATGETETPLYQNHRSWFMVDSSGRTMTPNGLYAFLDPGLPAVREYLARLYAEVATRYPVDGIHLDYIRYPEEKGDFSYQPSVVAEFRQTYHTTPEASPASWAAFRRQQVTKAVAAIASAVRQARPGVEVTASVIADTDKAYNQAFQPGLDWVRSGLLDAIAPMAYSGDMERFETLCAPYRDQAVRGKVWIGVWADANRNGNLVEEVRRAISMKFGAVSVFSYGEIFSGHRATARATGVYNAFVNQQTRISMAE